VRFEIDPPEGFRPVGAGEFAGRVRDAMHPVIVAARDVVHDLKALSPDQVEVKFGVKVSGTANWLVAKAVSAGSFEVTLTWRAADEAGEPEKTAESAESAQLLEVEVPAAEPQEPVGA
jgi:hypothetical protein